MTSFYPLSSLGFTALCFEGKGWTMASDSRYSEGIILSGSSFDLNSVLIAEARESQEGSMTSPNIHLVQLNSIPYPTRGRYRLTHSVPK